MPHAPRLLWTSAISIQINGANMRQRSRFPLNLIYGLESKRLLAYEKKINQSFDHSLFVSQQEADLFVNAFPKARNLTVIPNGVDHHYFSPEYLRIQGFRI